MSSVFISYSSKDKSFVERLENFLKKNDIKVWIDKGEIKLGDSLLTKITQGINDADYLAVILSPNSTNSNWVNIELEIAMNQEINSGKTKVLPLIIKKCNIPSFLKHKKYADLTNHEDLIDSLGDLLSLLKENQDEEKSFENKEIIKKTSKKEHERFLRIYGVLTETNLFGNSRFQSYIAKQIADVFCIEENYPKFKDFLDIFDELTETNLFGRSKFTKKDALEIALKRVGVNLSTYFMHIE